MTADTLVLLVLLLAIFASVVALGCTAQWHEAVSLWRRPGLLLRSLAAMYLLAPVVTLVVMEVVPAHRGVKIGLVLLAISCALAPNWKQMLALGGSRSYVFGLLFTTTLLAVITVPISLAILTALPLAEDATLPLLNIAALVAVMFLVPLGLGMALQRFARDVANRISDKVSGLAGLVMLASLLGLLALNVSAVREVGLISFVTVAGLVVAALALGHWLGGPGPGDRATLAIATAARFPGVAAVIAASSFPDKNAVVIIVTYMIVTIPLIQVYARWSRRQAPARALQTP